MRRWLWFGSPQMRMMQVLIDLTLVVEAISIDMVWKVLIRLMWTKTSWSSTMSAHLLPFSMLASSLNPGATGHCNLHWANINWSNTQYHVNHTKIKYESHPDLQFPGLSHLSMILQTTCLFSFDIQNNNWLNTRILAHMYKLESIHHSHTTPVKDQMWHIGFFTYVSSAWQMPMESSTCQQAPNCIAIGIFSTTQLLPPLPPPPSLLRLPLLLKPLSPLTSCCHLRCRCHQHCLFCTMPSHGSTGFFYDYLCMKNLASPTLIERLYMERLNINWRSAVKRQYHFKEPRRGEPFCMNMDSFARQGERPWLIPQIKLQFAKHVAPWLLNKHIFIQQYRNCF